MKVVSLENDVKFWSNWVYSSGFWFCYRKIGLIREEFNLLLKKKKNDMKESTN